MTSRVTGSLDPFKVPISSKANLVGAEAVIGSVLCGRLVANYSAVYGTTRRVHNRQDLPRILAVKFCGVDHLVKPVT